MSVVDIRAIVAELREQIIGMRLANLYDINKKTYLLKFAKTDEKIVVLIESGIRIHSTAFERDKSKMPSAFVLKLRKHIRTKRLENVAQLGVDRVVDFTFGVEEKAYHLIVEFFAKGNVVLTDHQYKIISLLRTHSKEAETGLFAVGETYPVSTRLQFEGISKTSLAQTFHNAIDKELTSAVQATTQEETPQDQKKKQHSKKAPTVPTLTVKNCLVNYLDYGTGFVEHVLLTSDTLPQNLNLLDSSQDLTKRLLVEIESVLNSTPLVETPILDKLVASFKEVDDFIMRIKTEKQKGYIILKDIVHQKQLDETSPQQQEENGSASASLEQTEPMPLNELQLKQIELLKEEKRLSIKRDQYDDFTPFLFEQVRRKIPTNPDEIKVITFQSFDKCADEFFSAIEAKKIESQKSSVENVVEKKLNKVKKEQELKLQELQASMDKYETIANLIEQYYEMVDQAIQVVCGALAQSQPWETIKQVIKEHRDIDPIAAMIHKLKLESSQITLMLPPPSVYINQEDDYEEDEEDEEEKNEQDESDESDEDNTTSSSKKTKEEPMRIDIDISMTAHANAAKYYALRKKSAENKEKATLASKKAIKKTEQKTLESAKKTQVKSEITLRRKRFWFEKFYWFITSENYLVLGGRDAQQNELLVKRYMRKGDIYVHADVHGASSCIIKNPTGEPIPPLSLQEAGMFCVCRSVAWDNKVMSSAYWVYDHQVSKTAPSGEYLTLGSFMIRGKKNFLPPSPLVMGFAVMFKVDESCIPNHLQERQPRMSAAEASDYLNKVSDAFANEYYDDAESSTTGGTFEEDTTTTSANDILSNDKHGTVTTTTSTSKAETTEEEDNRVHHRDNVTSEEILELEANHPTTNEMDDEEDENSQQNGTETKRRNLSAKEKKLLQRLKKKGMSDKEAREAILSGNIPEDMQKKSETKEQQQEDTTTEETATAEASSSSLPVHKPKGMKRGKWKKLKTKYADQDEEERKIMMELIGNKPKEKPKEEIDSKQLQKKKEEEFRKKKQEQAEIKKVLEEENIPFMDEEDREKLTEIDSLTGQPRDDDIFLFAIPVCAPYTCLKNYTYKVKLVPAGSSKKGKVGKEAVAILRSEAKSSPMVEACIKALDEADIGSCLVGNCRIATSQAKKSSAKSDKKKKTKPASSENAVTDLKLEEQ
ncbi:hypothetical protein C9374_004699 [Naegleria lovaniensis]|uniref:Uncharacterized protein n=1 Tax=Naegleria lovaniensis TaxID=51637 RepID=A0AA88GS63_NAELO|nr:uncharacterized protein C9374_004699 [Naegleria lovaniensis]KAG2383362.1 hypothetical protein C9374_004699 [Naegleria lovaniensis]